MRIPDTARTAAATTLVIAFSLLPRGVSAADEGRQAVVESMRARPGPHGLDHSPAALVCGGDAARRHEKAITRVVAAAGPLCVGYPHLSPNPSAGVYAASTGRCREWPPIARFRRIRRTADGDPAGVFLERFGRPWARSDLRRTRYRPRPLRPDGTGRVASRGPGDRGDAGASALEQHDRLGAPPTRCSRSWRSSALASQSACGLSPSLSPRVCSFVEWSISPGGVDGDLSALRLAVGCRTASISARPEPGRLAGECGEGSGDRDRHRRAAGRAGARRDPQGAPLVVRRLARLGPVISSPRRYSSPCSTSSSRSRTRRCARNCSTSPPGPVLQGGRAYQVDKSKQTKTMNAYVNGSGPPSGSSCGTPWSPRWTTSSCSS